MKISVITVTLNAAPHVEAALTSLRAQTHPNIELLVIDGGSTDDTLACVSRFADLNPRVITGRDNGIYDAMNKGVRAATGEAVYFLNADDRLVQPEALAQLAYALHCHPEAFVAYGDVVVASEHEDQYRSHAFVSRERLGYDTLCHQAALVRREAFDRVGWFDARYRISADLEWFIRCGKAELGFVHVPRLICRYAAGGESDRQTQRRLQENRAILQQHRSGWQRAQQRVAAAWRRRVKRVARVLG